MRLTPLLLAAALAAPAAYATPVTYAIDPSHTFVTFEALHFGTSTNRGRFDKKQGSVVLDRVAKTGKVELTIETASVNTGVGPFDKHLIGPDFFETEIFPTATFVGDKFSFSGDKVTAVAGTLTLLGKSQPVTLKAVNYNCYDHPLLKREVCGGDFEGELKRSDFGIDYGLPFVADRVRIRVQVEGIREP